MARPVEAFVESPKNSQSRNRPVSMITLHALKRRTWTVPISQVKLHNTPLQLSFFVQMTRLSSRQDHAVAASNKTNEVTQDIFNALNQLAATWQGVCTQVTVRMHTWSSGRSRHQVKASRCVATART